MPVEVKVLESLPTRKGSLDLKLKDKFRLFLSKFFFEKREVVVREF